MRAEDIRSAVSITSLIQKYGHSPNRAGYISCPFHGSDRTASLRIYPDQGSWHCYGCNKGGSVIDWVMHSEGLGFRESISWLAAEFSLTDEPLTKHDRTRMGLARQQAARIEARKAVLKSYIHQLDRQADHYRNRITHRHGQFSDPVPNPLPEDIAYWQSQLDYIDYMRGEALDEYHSLSGSRQ